MGEDLDRGRVHLPADELAAFGVDRDLLVWCRRHGRTEPRVRAALADQHTRTREVYRLAQPGVAMLAPASRPCIATATTLYARILDRLEEIEFDVFARRATVGRARRARVAAGPLVAALLARHGPALRDGPWKRAPGPDEEGSTVLDRPQRPAVPERRTVLDRTGLRALPRIPWARQRPTWAQASPAVIDAALQRALSRPSGNWFVLGAARDVRPGRPLGSTVAGVELVAWRDAGGGLLVGPGACPHLGAPLADAVVDGGDLVCRWHGLRLGRGGCGGWRTLPAHDDGVLAWVRLDGVGGEPPTDLPPVPPRPPLAGSVDAVVRIEARCEPEDVVANRLDPWHGAWLHPYSFTELTVREAPPVELPDGAPDRFVVDVTFTLTSRLGAPVEAEFTCPGPRTVLMTITAGEGAGSVVETHATPLGSTVDGPRTASSRPCWPPRTAAASSPPAAPPPRCAR